MPTPKMTRIAELDGLRGLAALAVVVAHYLGEVRHGFTALTVGWYAVDFFFVLSGFLMGSIILKRHAEIGFLKSFYLRRAARIIPIYFVVVSATLGLAALTQGHLWSDHPFSASTYFLFLTNFAVSFSSGGGEWLTPAWTLAVEEQFYLLLPLIVIWLPRRFLLATLCTLCAAALLYRIAVHGVNPMAALVLLPGRMDLLFGGVIVACVKQQFDFSRHLRTIRLIPLAAIGFLLGVTLFSPDRVFPVLNPTLLAICFSAFLLAVLYGAPEGARYRSPWLRFFGRISYALYLIHQPVAGLLHGLLLDSAPDIATLPQIAVTALSFAVSVALAAASWRWLESPILAREEKNRSLPVEGARQNIS